jgi:hypothetical protein
MEVAPLLITKDLAKRWPNLASTKPLVKRNSKAEVSGIEFSSNVFRRKL